MATQWYYQMFGHELGPVPFARLVGMVREQQLVQEDLVRPAYAEEWRRADEAVGLFHIARRTAVVEESHTLDDALSSKANLLGVTVIAGAMPAGDCDGRTNRPSLDAAAGGAAAPTDRDVAMAIARALADVDSRSGRDKSCETRVGRWRQRWRAFRVNRCFVRDGVRFGAAFIAASAAITWIEACSAHERLRFPGLMDERGLRVFPSVGPCHAGDYWFFALDFALLVGVAGYFGMRWIEKQLD